MTDVYWFGELHAIVLNEVRDVVGLPFRVVTTVTDSWYIYEFTFFRPVVQELSFSIPNNPSTSTDEVRAIVLDAVG